VEESALDAVAKALVPRWVDEGLVRRRAEDGGRVVIEPLHEALAKGWPQLGRWLDEVRADRELVRDAQRHARRWERHGRPGDMLWGGTLLKSTEALGGIEEEPGREFVGASLAAAAALLAAAEGARKRAFWVTRVLPAAVVGVVLASALTGWWMTSRAKQRTDEALGERNTALAESRKSEKKAKDSEQEALQQKGVAEQERKKAEDANNAVAKLAQQNKEDYETLSKATTLKELKAIKKNIDDKRRAEATKTVDQPAASSKPVVKPLDTVIPPMQDPF
jgi:hypothetical protein